LGTWRKGELMATTPGYEFVGGYPTAETVRRAYDEADLNRAVQAYRFFYPSVSIMATWKANLRSGMVANKVFGLLEGTPKQYVFTPNSDTRTRACRWMSARGRWCWNSRPAR